MVGMSHKSASGFTLFELVMVMAIATILLTIAIPSFKYVTTSNRISTEINGLLGDMQYARSEAIKEGLTVTVCSSPSTGSPRACGNSQWQNGWIAFLDSNGNQQVDPGEVVLRAQSDFSASGDTLEPYNNVTFNAITFNREGYASTPNSVTITLQLHDSTSNPAWTRCLAISPVGMLTTQKNGVGNCS